ncbi:hypothetical protein EF847_18275 [Actinobacteria bacterium YIM 96077]|uniref:PABS domain-containing protein n=1 Tax=Phytoactinopolyspora halophila TaxID=1981511 RepID=A0A329QI66_9ACTN|nr:hypothetical protein [Phytoactinopolyspora halophila]AYY14350.1 hypothetical protein EF847_18275 [Actinobacteria bacterium YIM 96077]RAW11926.1 hypothetical protein DPM12_15845 [Phytoactinopolyspora halophila]
MDESPETLARGDGVGGEIVLRRRNTGPGEIHELIVNGAFLMDTAETSTERLLAEAVLDQHPAPRRILIGGLGLGFTVRALLDDPRVEHVDVVELEPLLVEWLRAGLVPGADTTLADARVEIRIADVRDVLAEALPDSYDAILLDVDNGPGFLVHESNAHVYEPATLSTAARALAGEGMLAIWSAAPSDALASTLADTIGDVAELVRTVRRQERDVEYHVYLARHPGRPG